ncbi:hypothetical protein [Thalassotalea litorea]|uniref:hypothetical protein n=1 Tax=Thalassotalea litorea TaxID=2020715 RepID=UPI003735E2C8
MESGYWFKSTLFEIEKHEDEDTNPGCYGKSLATWLSTEFAKLGYETEVIPEDWGWCVMCVYDDYLLWLGCGAMQSEESLENYEEGRPPKGSEVVWHVFPQLEVPFFKFSSLINKWLGKLDVETPLENLKNELDKVLRAENNIQFCDEP